MHKLILIRARPVILSLILAAAAPFAFSQAQFQGQGPEGRPPRIDFASALSLDAKTAQAFEQVMREQHDRRKALGIDRETIRAKHETMRQETEQKLAQIFTPEQLKKFQQLRPHPHRDGPPPHRDGPPSHRDGPPPHRDGPMRQQDCSCPGRDS